MSNSLIPSRLILRHSNVSGEKPVSDDLLLGEVFINIPDNKLYYRNRDLVNQIVEIELTTSNDLLHVRDVDLINGQLIATYSDNTTKPLGNVIGPAGRGLAIDGIVDYVEDLPTSTTIPPIANILNKNGTLFVVRLGENSSSLFDPAEPKIYSYSTIEPHWTKLTSVAAKGEDGEDGNTIISGTATTPNIVIGNNGDYYLDTNNYILFGPKTNGVWPEFGVNLRGGVEGLTPTTTLTIGQLNSTTVDSDNIVADMITSANSIRSNGTLTSNSLTIQTGTNPAVASIGTNGSIIGTSLNVGSGTVTGATFSGNATSASTLNSNRTNWATTNVINNVVGQLAWKNAGNNHTIFDASAGTSPTGVNIDDIDSNVPWSSEGLPTLMGWNGSQTVGVRVDRSRYSDTAGIANSATSVIDGVITASKLNGSQTGTAPVFGVRAWANFNAQSNTDVDGTFSRSGQTVTVTVTGHGLIVGNLIFLDFTGGTATPDGLYVVASVTNANVFTVTSAASATGTGTVALRRKTIRASGNISCISASPENPVIPPTSSAFQDDGFYIANFSVAMPDSNFAVFGSCNEGFPFTAASGNDILSGAAYNAQCARVLTISGGGTAVDCVFNSFSVVG